MFHAPFIEATPGMELAAVVTSDPDRAAAAAAAHPSAAVLGSAAELWFRAGELAVDLAVVTVPNRFHVPAALVALEARLGVVVDKPLAATAADGRRLVDHAARRGLFLSVFHNRRWDGDFLTVRRIVHSGELGQVRRFESRYERWRPEMRAGGWRERADPEDAGGLLADLGSHLIDQAVVLFGPPVSVYAELHCRRPGSVVDDDTFVALEHRDGVVSHLWASSVVPRPGPRFRVLGSQAGYVVWGMDPQEQALHAGVTPSSSGWGESPPSQWGTMGVGDDTVVVQTEPGAYGRFYEGVAAALRDGSPPPVAPADALITLEVIDAARRSAAIHRPVRVNPK